MPLYVDCQRTLEEIGDEMGISRERVRQLEHRALQKCRRWCDRHGYDLADLLPTLRYQPDEYTVGE